jgi:hypothetical protein
MVAVACMMISSVALGVFQLAGKMVETPVFFLMRVDI